MIESSVDLGSAGGVICQLLDVTGTNVAEKDVAVWLATHPWITPYGRVAVTFDNLSERVRMMVVAALLRVGFYEVMVASENGWVTVGSIDPNNIGQVYPNLALVDAEAVREA
jgi:hypothetical protein